MSTSHAGRMALFAVLIAPVLIAGMLWGATSTGAQEGSSTDLLIKVTVPAEKPSEGAEDVMVTITVENAKNFGAFGFQLTYDPNILEVAVDPATQQPLIQRGDFLGSTGREIACPDPESQRGVLRVRCNSLRLEPAGPDGAGTLATITFRAVGSGTTELTLDKLEANNPDATEIRPIQVQSATLSVQGSGGMNWMLWGPIGGIIAAVVVGGGAFAATKRRGATAA